MSDQAATATGTARRGTRSVTRLFLVVPLATLVVAYLGICQTVGTFAPWSIVVHENGVLTLTGTILYFDHAARELPLDLLVGLMVGAAAAIGLYPAGSGRSAAFFAGTAALVSAGILVGSLMSVGYEGTVLNIVQAPTRPGVEPVVGSHWYFHLLSTAFALLASLAVGCMISGREGVFRLRGPVAGAAVVALAGALSWVFLTSPDLFRHSLSDPVYLGHQAREILVVGLITVPLAFAICLLVSEKPSMRGDLPGPKLLAVAFSLAAAGVAAYAALAAIAKGAQDIGQSQDLRVLVFPHFFEHILSYLVSAPVAAAAFILVGSSGRRA